MKRTRKTPRPVYWMTTHSNEVRVVFGHTHLITSVLLINQSICYYAAISDSEIEADSQHYCIGVCLLCICAIPSMYIHDRPMYTVCVEIFTGLCFSKFHESTGFCEKCKNLYVYGTNLQLQATIRKIKIAKIVKCGEFAKYNTSHENLYSYSTQIQFSYHVRLVCTCYVCMVSCGH